MNRLSSTAHPTSSYIKLHQANYPFEQAIPMTNISTDSIALDNTPVSDHKTSNLKTSNLELSIDDSQTDVDSPLPLLPRSAWTSQVALLRVIFRAKKALDRIEQEAGLLRG
ncbi:MULTISPECIES: hypothetical protein [unclassified Moorena]|uniref:hypothetical protein n=1 Tax=unclassified Moorena TaxID=2683338 RepID=UPI001400E65F|nr:MULTISPECIES: hypothetical protein [unclassified Moorena]NEO12626.1 hypothetical protein [Moorena sp. SIO3E8]NEP97662.1 hypothetical protein [Moorena sp. SIO3F7]